MTTEALRKVIKVTDWSLTKEGLTISYVREDHNPKSLHLILTPIESALELEKIGAIDGHDTEIVFSIIWKGYDMNWATFLSNFKMCQWEALSIAIRHEAMKDLDNDIDMLEMDSALNALKQD